MRRFAALRVGGGSATMLSTNCNETMETITLNSPVDMHIHFRDGDLMRAVVPWTARAFAGALAMPNLVPPVDSLERVRSYRREILAAAGDRVFEPFMVLFFRDYTREELEAARGDIIGVKLYPEGITTNSSGGVRSFDDAERVMSILEELDIPLLVHGETNGFVLEREHEFVEIYARWAKRFPRLRITLEHVTDRRTLGLLDDFENLAATVTVHHLYLTLDDLLGGQLAPHSFCKPIVKTPEDREALRRAVTSGHPKLFFGSDSAPHTRTAKMESGAAGVYSAPVALPLLVQLFEEHGALHNLPSFVAYNAARHYRMTPEDRTVTLVKAPFEVPQVCEGDIVPMFAGKTLPWRVCD